MNQKFKIINRIENLSFLEELTDVSAHLKLYGDFEIEPFTKWSTGFSAVYWYLKYMLLANKSLNINEDLQELNALFKEPRLNIIWFNITDEESFILECKDGDWHVSFLNTKGKIYTFFDKFKLVSI